MEQNSRWKTFAVVIAAIAGLITAIATLLPNLLPFFGDDADTADSRAGPDSGPPSSAAQGEAQLSQAATPSASSEPFSDAEAVRAAERAAAQYISALQRGDLDTLVALAQPPFFMDQGQLLLTKSDIRERLGQMLSSRDPDRPLPNPDEIRARLIGQAKETGWSPEQDRVTSRLGLSDEDIQVVAIFEEEGVVFYFRRGDQDVSLAGLWD